jgi:hypothetical protein
MGILDTVPKSNSSENIIFEILLGAQIGSKNALDPSF